MPITDPQTLNACTKVLDWLEIAKIAAPIIVGLISAYAATTLALKKSKKEKHWDEKRSAYNKVIQALEELQYWADKVRSEHCCEPSNSVEANQDEALREIQRYSKIGALIFTDAFHSALHEANSAINQVIFAVNEESLGDRNDEREMGEWRFHEAIEIRKIIDEYLPKMIAIAKNELPKTT